MEDDKQCLAEEKGSAIRWRFTKEKKDAEETGTRRENGKKSVLEKTKAILVE